MKKINIREALLDIDRRTNAQYDLTTLYEACKLSEDDKKKVVQYIDTKEPPFMIGEFLASKCDAVCEAIVGDDEVSEAEMKKIVDDINDGGDHTLWALMDKADEEDKKLTEAAEEPREGYDSRAAIRQVWRMIASSETLTDDDSRYWDLDRGVHEGDDAVVIHNVEEAPNTAMYQFSLMDDGIDLDVMLDRMSDNDTWYIIDNSSTKYGDNDDSLNEDIISVDTAELENKIRAAATDVVVNNLGYDEDFARQYLIVETSNTDAEDARVKVEVRADLSYEESEKIADALNPIVRELDKDAYFDFVTHNTLAAYIRLDQSDDVVDEEAFNYWKGLFDKVTTRGDLINYYKELVRKRDEGSITWGTMDKLFDEVIGPLNDRLDAENAPKVEESLDEAAVGTMERPMTELQGTLSSILSSDWNAWAKIRHVEDAVAFLNEIAPQCKNKGYIEKVKSKLLSNPRTNIQQFFTNIIMAGDGQGVVKTGKSARIARDRKDLGEGFGGSSLYLFPELTAEDLEMAKAYGLTYLGKNHGPDGSENNCVVAGDMSSLERYADKYLGYELHPDYLYDDADDFAGEILKEAVKYPNGQECRDDSVDMDKALDYMFGTDRDPDINSYTEDEKQRAVNYWIEKTDSPFNEAVELTICPNCGGERFNDNTGLCVDCGYDEKGHGDLDESRSIKESASSNTLEIIPFSGSSREGFKVSIKNPDGEELFKKEYRYGQNASYEREFALWKDVEDAKKFVRNTPYALNPHVADIIDELCSQYGINKNDIQFTAGEDISAGTTVSDEFIDRMKSHIYESKSIKESRPDKEQSNTFNKKVTIKYGNSVKEVESCKPIKVTNKQLQDYRDNYSQVNIVESKSINEDVEVIYQKGNKKIVKDDYGYAIDDGINANRFYVTDDGTPKFDDGCNSKFWLDKVNSLIKAGKVTRRKNESEALNEYYDFIDRKSVEDSDGFMTDYTMYKDVANDRYVFVFGDSDIYSPEDGDFDWECETEEEAYEWFNSYTGFADEEDDDTSWLLDEGAFDNIKKTATTFKNAFLMTPGGAGMADLASKGAEKVKNSKLGKKVKDSWNHDKTMHEVEQAIKGATSKTALIRKVRPMYNKLKKEGKLSAKDDALFQSLFNKQMKKVSAVKEDVNLETLTVDIPVTESADAPYTREELEKELKSLTKDFTVAAGDGKCGFREEAEMSKEILSKYYKSVKVYHVGDWFVIMYKDLINGTEDVKESISDDQETSNMIVMMGSDGVHYYYNAKENTFTSDPDEGTRYAEIEIMQSDFDEIKKNNPEAYMRKIPNMPHWNK